MPLQNCQVKFIEENSKSKKEIKDNAGFFTKQNIKAKYRKLREPKSIKEILSKITPNCEVR